MLLRDGGGARTVQGRTLWDPATAGLGSAQRIAYRIEARDRDDVSPARREASARRGRRARCTSIIQNPHESLEDRLERQRDLLEKLIGDLADRLERGARADERPRRWRATWRCTTPRRRTWRCSASSIDEDRRNGTLGKALRAALGRHRRSPGDGCCATRRRR